MPRIPDTWTVATPWCVPGDHEITGHTLYRYLYLRNDGTTPPVAFSVCRAHDDDPRFSQKVFGA